MTSDDQPDVQMIVDWMQENAPDVLAGRSAEVLQTRRGWTMRVESRSVVYPLRFELHRASLKVARS